MDQLGLTFNELEAYAFGTKSATPEQIAVKAHERKRQSGNVLEVVPEGTPTEVVEHRLPEEELACKACGSQMEEIGKKVRRTLQMKPAKFWIREDVYYTYAYKNCERETGEANILNMPKEPALLLGSFASAEAVAHLMTQKFVMHSPLYRLEQEFNHQGLKLSRQTMSNWLLKTSEMLLQPIYEVLHERLCKEQVLHADETTLQVLKEAGRPSTSKSYMWLYRTSGCAEMPIVLYEYQSTRKAEHAETLAKLTPEERHEKRLEQEKPVLDALLSWANEMQAKTAPKSAMGRAIHYLLEQWPYLVRYLEDGRLELSNNRAERSIKPFVMGRRTGCLPIRPPVRRPVL